MSLSQAIAILFVLVGVAALGWNRQTFLQLDMGGEGARLLLGVSSMLLGGILLLLTQLRQSLEH